MRRTYICQSWGTVWGARVLAVVVADADAALDLETSVVLPVLVLVEVDQE